MKYTKGTLSKLESIFDAIDYRVRYEQGNFRAGACSVNGSQIVVINKNFNNQGKINSLIQILKEISEKIDFQEYLSEEQLPSFYAFISHKAE